VLSKLALYPAHVIDQQYVVGIYLLQIAFAAGRAQIQPESETLLNR